MKVRWMYFLASVVIVAITSFFFTACIDDDEKNARIEVRLTDAPGDYEEVNIDIQAVEIHASGGDQDEGWRTLDIVPGIYNVLELTNGLDTLLGTMEVPAGMVSQIRLVLGDNNTIKVDGQTYDMDTPSAQQSGLKLNVHTELKGGILYTFLLDFDAARSIVLTGSDDYKLKPVIRLITVPTSGSIKGVVEIPEATPAVYAIMEDDTLGTTFADSLGAFRINGLPAGIYTVSFAPATGYTIADAPNIAVEVGEITDLGTVTVIDLP